MSNIQLVENLYRLRKAHHYTTKPVNGHRIWIL